MNGKQLKNSILQWAIQGRLVPQDPTDEPASVLLQRIQTEKARLVKEGKLKKSALSDSVIFRGEDNKYYEKVGKTITCIDEDIPFEIPESWEWVRLGNIIHLQSGQDLTPDKYNASEDGIPYLTGASNLENGKVIINRWTQNGRAFSYKGELLLTCKGTVGSMAILQELVVHIARQFMSIRPMAGFDILYGKIYLETYIGKLQSAAKSMIPGIERTDILQLFLPLPPLAEQHRIVAKVEEVLSVVERYEKAQDALDTLCNSLDGRLRKSILSEAIQGHLVPQDPTDEPASQLLQRIQAEKAKLVKEGKLKKAALSDSVIFRGEDNKYYEKVGKTITCIDEDIPFEIPETWEWCRFGNIMINRDSERIPLSVSQRQSLDKVYDYYGASGVIDKVDKYLFDKDLLLIGEDGANLLYRSTPIAFIAKGKYWVNNHAHVLDACGGLNLPYMSMFINAISLADYITGTAQPKMNQKMMNSILIPLPPLAEQRRIVAKVEEVFAVLDRLACK